VDSDLAESIAALRGALGEQRVKASLGRADAELVRLISQKLKVPRRYREFLVECDPVDLEVVTPAERVRLIPAGALEDEQVGFSLTDSRALLSEPSPTGWRPGWVIVAQSTLLGDPYFLDTADPDAEGDCPVYTAMSGTDKWQPKLCASSFALFVRILSIGIEVARDFDVDDYDVDNEQVFREALGPKIRAFDPAALKAGHWT
jgi:hypothetical protein